MGRYPLEAYPGASSSSHLLCHLNHLPGRGLAASMGRPGDLFYSGLTVTYDDVREVSSYPIKMINRSFDQILETNFTALLMVLISTNVAVNSHGVLF